MEIELRAKLSNSSALIKEFRINPKFIYQGALLQKDIYFKLKTDPQRKLIIRIRSSGNAYLLTFKAKASGQDTAWSDFDIPTSKPDNLKKILLNSGFEELVTIIKSRRTYKYQGLEINLDAIKGLGNFIEIEAKGTSLQRKKLESKLKTLLLKLGVPEKNIIYEGYVPLAIRKK